MMVAATKQFGWAVIGLLLLLVWPARADQPLLLLTAGQGQVQLGQHLQLLADPGKQLTFAEVSSPAYNDAFVAATVNTPQFGYTSAAHWARFSVRNSSPANRNWLLEVSDATLDSLRLYLLPVGSSTPALVVHTGDLLPRSTRPVEYHHFVFDLPLEPNRDYTVYLRVENQGATSLPLTLWSPPAFAEHKAASLFWSGFSLGFIVIMVCFHLVLLLFLREAMYLFYIVAVASLGFYFAVLDGLAAQYLWPNQLWWGNVAILVFIGLSLMGGIQFGVRFLQLASFAPRLDKNLRGLSLLVWGALVLAILPGFYRPAAIALAVLTVATVVIGVVTAAVVLTRGYRPARYFLAGWIGIFVGATLVVLSQFSLLPENTLTGLSVRVGAFLLVLLLSLAMADRIHLLRTQAETANRRLHQISQRKQAEEALRQRNQQLALLNHAGQIFSSTLELNQVIQNILGEMHRLLDVEATSYWLHVPETGELVCQQASGPGNQRVVGWRLAPGQGVTGRAMQTGQPLIVADLLAEPDYFADVDKHTGLALRSLLTIPLRVKGETIGVLNLASTQFDRFSQDDVSLLEPIAAVAASAIKNAQLFDETQRQRTIAESLRHVSTIINSSVELNTVLAGILEQLRRVIRFDGAGLFLLDGSDLRLIDGTAQVQGLIGYRLPVAGNNITIEPLRQKKTLVMADIQTDPRWREDWPALDTYGLAVRGWMGAPLLRDDTPIGVLTVDSFEKGSYTEKDARILETFADQAALAIQNAKLFEQAQHQRQMVENALAELKATQNQLVVQEKMASLGMLTAGIAHEIKNPLNFVTSFAQLSIELAQDLEQILGRLSFKPETQAEIDDILHKLRFNARNITDEGFRANSIVQSMLLHSRGGGNSQRQPTDVNSLLQEAVNLSFHSLRAKDIEFDVQIETHLDPALTPLHAVPQDLSRVFVNLINNAYDATREKQAQTNGAFEARIVISTKNLDNWVEITVADNGVGIAAAKQAELFTPFFTTKPSGQGTGLGLSISYDIIVQEHQGTISVKSDEGQLTEFAIRLPKKSALTGR